ncbi:aldo/keto reductase [Dactylosporangium vinaceum]|uniref:Aldo/keto reductase n=1 Tax=Dactylosporangium vinaceum TaxID=53362 RepID=A0ABV5MD49_9ACTN|nr:aldo/keto reductase [Dactylosporangium vinaceum]UAC00830.1 aldo/keto reductase [Dactylosporangium vinaceum]
MIPRRAAGRSGLQLSAVSLGGMTFGRGGPFGSIGTDASDVTRIVALALDAGIDSFDTANVYGESEELLGRLLGRHRDDVVIATKVRFPIASAAAGRMPPASTYGLSRSAVIRAVEGSLRRLDTDRIDVLWLHMQDRTVPIQETLSATEALIQQGKVRYLGLSNFMGYRVSEAVLRAELHRLEAPVALQIPWSLVDRDAEQELVPAAGHFGLGVVVYSPLGRGFLSGKYERGHEPAAGSRLAQWPDEFGRYDTDRNWSVLADVRQIAADHAAPVSAVALAWLLAKRTVTSVIIGARTEAQLQDNLAAARLRLTRDEIERLDKVSEPVRSYPSAFIGRFEQW